MRTEYLPARLPLNSLGEEVRRINHINGWNVTVPSDWDETAYKIPAILALITSEVSEGLEAFRHNDKENFAEEMADVLIRLLDLTRGLGIDLDHEVWKKMKKNCERGHRHGGKRV